jgi:hypothetical protein
MSSRRSSAWWGSGLPDRNRAVTAAGQPGFGEPISCRTSTWTGSGMQGAPASPGRAPGGPRPHIGVVLRAFCSVRTRPVAATSAREAGRMALVFLAAPRPE